MNRSQAEQISRAVWGRKGVAWEVRRFRGDEKPSSDGWVRAKGPIILYQVGYARNGKKGATLSTIKGRSSIGFKEAFQDALKEMEGTKLHWRLEASLEPLWHLRRHRRKYRAAR
jgi:hypothetical protein